MNKWGNTVGVVLLTGGIVGGAGALSAPAMTTWEYATVPLMIHTESKPQADRWGLFVGEWTPTFFAIAATDSSQREFALAASTDTQSSKTEKGFGFITPDDSDSDV